MARTDAGSGNDQYLTTFGTDNRNRDRKRTSLDARSVKEIVETAGETMASLGVDCETDVVQGSPAPTIVDYAERYQYDLVVLPTSGREGVARLLLGSVTEKTVRSATVPVFTRPFRRGILICSTPAVSSTSSGSIGPDATSYSSGSSGSNGLTRANCFE